MEIENPDSLASNIRPFSSNMEKTPQTPVKGCISGKGSRINTPFTPTTPLSARSTNTVGTPNGTPSAREKARLAKLQNTSEKIRRVSMLKEKWAKEKEEKLQRFKETRETELRRAQEASAAVAEQRRKNLEINRRTEEATKELERETLKLSLEDRTRVLAEMEKRERDMKKKQLQMEADIARKNKEVAQMMASKQKEEEHDFLESRRLDFLEQKERNRQEKDKERQQLVDKAEEERRSKLQMQALDQKKAEEEQGYLEFRKLAWEGRRHARDEDQRRKRESLANRGEKWKLDREVGRDLQIQEMQQQQQDLECRRLDWQAMESYKHQLVHQERESVASRLEKWRQEKAYQSWANQEEQEAAEYERELTAAAREDQRKYLASLDKARRQSLAYRLEKARQEKTLEAGQRELKQVLEAEEFRLRTLEREDVAAYQQSLRDSKRQSLEYRTQHFIQQKLLAQGEKEALQQLQQENFELNEMAWKDVQKYQEQMRDEERKEIARRLVAARKQHQQDLQNHQQSLEKLHEEMSTRRMNWLDEQSYEQQQQQRRRMSVAYRLDSWRQQKLAEEMLQARDSFERDEDARLKAQDWEDLQEAKKRLQDDERQNLVQGRMVF